MGFAGGARWVALIACFVACSATTACGRARDAGWTGSSGHHGDAGRAARDAGRRSDVTSPGDAGFPSDDLDAASDNPCARPGACHTPYSLYAHSDHVLYRLDLASRALEAVGPFRAPSVTSPGGSEREDAMTDLAVSPEGILYLVSPTSLYTASPVDGHVTRIGPLSACGTFAVALTFTPNGKLYAGDFGGAFCRIDLATEPPTVVPVARLSDGYALSGDIVAVSNGTMFGTAYRLEDAANTGTQRDNTLVRIDPETGRVTPLGATSAPRLFGVAYELGQVFAFTHDGSGRVLTLDRTTGTGTLYARFTDPDTGGAISFAGAGVNAMVPLVF